MVVSQPVTETLDISEARGRLDSLVSRVSGRRIRILLKEGGVPLAALVSTDDLERLIRLDQERVERFRVIDEVQVAFKDVPPEEIDCEADRAVAELRAEAAAKA